MDFTQTIAVVSAVTTALVTVVGVLYNKQLVEVKDALIAKLERELKSKDEEKAAQIAAKDATIGVLEREVKAKEAEKDDEIKGWQAQVEALKRDREGDR